MPWVALTLAASAAACTAASVALLKRGWMRPSQLWWAVAAYSLACIVGILVTWRALALRPPPDDGQVLILSQDELDSFLEVQARLLPPGAERPAWVPSGLFLQSVRFVDTTRVEVAGYLWQKYGPDLPADLPHGFRLPDASATDADPAYTQQNGNESVEGWSFLATVRMHTDVRDYPFDRQVIALRIRPAAFGANVVLVPDVQSYPGLDPATLPGLEPGLWLENWRLLAAGFSFLPSQGAALFGLSGAHAITKVPDLYYRIHLTRNITGALFTNLIVPIFASLLNFLVLLVCTVRGERAGVFGFNIANVLRAVASLSFVIIFAQLNLRNQQRAEEAMYIETFYFMLYPALILVVVNAFLCARKDRLWWITWEDNLIPKLAYWPVLLGWWLTQTTGLL